MERSSSFREFEKKWQTYWLEHQTYSAKEPSANQDTSKYYGLVEFPYPSGEGLHVGHPRSYVALDVMTRKRRMEGKNVLYPIGWDAFGLPTENFAIKYKLNPAEATRRNVANFKRQIQSLGIGFDWEREINTTDPGYYRWTQWMFLQFYQSYFDEKRQKAVALSENVTPEMEAQRMAFKAETTINWCPRCKIGLANEEAQSGVCERCGNSVEQRLKKQWMIRITSYADRLVSDLDQVDYLEKIKAQQINWIGRSEGAYVDFLTGEDRVTVFTTRPETLFGVTYVVLAPEHPLIQTWTKEGRVQNQAEVERCIQKARLKSDLQRQEQKEKTGVEIQGLQVEHPLTKELLPVWMSDYVLASYGTGAVMAVPAHDERDFAFAKQFGLPMKQVVEPLFFQTTEPGKIREDIPFDERETIIAIVQHPTEEKYLALRWKSVAWGTFITGGIESGQTAEEAAKMEIREETGYLNSQLIRDFGVVHGKFFHVIKNTNRLAHARVLFFRLANEERSVVDTKETDLHEVLWLTKDELSSFLTPDTHLRSLELLNGKMVYSGDGFLTNSDFLNGLPTKDAKEICIAWLEQHRLGKKQTNFRLRDWVFSRQRYWGEPIPLINCETCGIVPVPEEQLPVTLPPIASYEPTDTGESPLAALRDWVEVACPQCGGKAERETDTMPNWAGSSWYFLRYCDPHNQEAFASSESMKYWLPVDLYNGGMEHTTLHLLYSRFWYKVLWDLGHIPAECSPEPYARRRSHAMILGEGGVKMSKSKGNVVNPDEVVELYGADVFRMYEMFIGPFDADAPWDTHGIEGVKRFLEKAWRILTLDGDEQPLEEDVERVFHQTIKKVSEDIEAMHFNTAVSALMILFNSLQTVPSKLEKSVVEAVLKLLAPFAPHLSEEIWMEHLGHTESIHLQAWPMADSTKLKATSFEMVIQVNGKLRDKVRMSLDVTEKEAVKVALTSELVQASLHGKEVIQSRYVSGRLVNIVTK